MNQEITTVNAKYIFIDIVSYTYNRSIEAQTDLIRVLNKIVSDSIEQNKIPNEHVLYIPTGDGICITLLDILHPHDIHIKIALSILEKLFAHNESIKDEMRKFSLRIGINENLDNLIIDINKQKNIAGSGINFASRILSLCDQNQILVGRSVFEKLVQREKYMNSFTKYIGTVKHGIPLEVYQFKNDDLLFLNNNIPSLFRPEPKSIKRLSKLLGYYFANCINNEDFILKNNGMGQESYILTILNFQLAEDALAKSKVTKSDPYPIQKIEKSMQEQFNYMQKMDFWLLCDLSNMIIEKHLEEYRKYFDNGYSIYLFINEAGRNKLLQEHPDICKEYGIE